MVLRSRHSALLLPLLLTLMIGPGPAVAHQATIENNLPSSLVAECLDPAKDPASTVVYTVDPGRKFNLAVDDVSRSRVCIFSWLGTSKVKDIVVWERDACDSCYWRVDSSGFSRQQYDGSFKLVFLWKKSCFVS